MKLLIHPHDFHYAKLREAPTQFVLDLMREEVLTSRPSVYELYEAIFGLETACSVTLVEAESTVLEHLEMWHGAEAGAVRGCLS